MKDTQTVIIGDGIHMVGGIITAEGLHGVEIVECPRPHGRRIDSPADDFDDMAAAALIENLPSIRIMARSVKAARVMQDQFSALAMRMNGYVVENAVGDGELA
jgi:hypothetical protein